MGKTTLADSMRGASDSKEGYDGFFSDLIGIISERTVDDALGADIRDYVSSWLAAHPLTAFDDFSADTYRRTYLGRSAGKGWEAIVMSWKHGNRTSIHAHPQFAGYNFADGVFRIEIFEPAGGRTARRVRDTTVEAPCAFFAVGGEGRFDNHIHRITCLSETGHSLHVYSDDALRGEVYVEAEP